MADKKIEVDESLLLDMQKQIKDLEARTLAAETAALVTAVAEGKKDIREIESLTERFKLKELTLRKLSITGADGKDKGGIVIGWTPRGAYEVVDKSGANAVLVNMMDVFFLGGSDKPTTIKASDLVKGERIKCKEISRDMQVVKHKTGEEIEVSEFKTEHGLVATGTIIDGYYAQPEGTYTVSIPEHDKPVTINQMFFNA